MEKIITLEDICKLIDDKDIEAIFCEGDASWSRDYDDDIWDDGEIPIEYYNEFKHREVTSIVPYETYNVDVHRIIIHIK